MGHVLGLFAVLATVGNRVVVNSKYEAIAIARSEFSSFVLMAAVVDSDVDADVDAWKCVLRVIAGVYFS
jgi:HEAT repeat protein